MVYQRTRLLLESPFLCDFNSLCHRSNPGINRAAFSFKLPTFIPKIFQWYCKSRDEFVLFQLRLQVLRLVLWKARIDVDMDKDKIGISEARIWGPAVRITCSS